MDARFPTRYLNDRRVLKLSAEQFRAWAMATAWSVTNATDGAIEKDDLPLIPPFTTTAADAAALVEAGLWKATGKGWLILEFASTQTSSAEMARIERRRLADREYRAQKRAEERGQESGDDDSRPDVDNRRRADGRNDVVPTVVPTPGDGGPDKRQSAGSRADSRADVVPDVDNDGQGKSKSKSKGSLRGGSQTELEDSSYPTDQRGKEDREKIERHGIKSVDELVSFAQGDLSPVQAQKIWDGAYPQREVS